MNVQPESLIKTIILFKDGLVNKAMPLDRSMANAMICFHEYGFAMRNGVFPQLKFDTSRKYFKTLVDAYAEWDENTESPIDEAHKYTEKQQRDVVAAFTKLSNAIIRKDGLPLKGGSRAVEKIWNKLQKEYAI